MRELTLVSGFLGAGKTAVLNHLLGEHGRDGLAGVSFPVGSATTPESTAPRFPPRLVPDGSRLVPEVTHECRCCLDPDALSDHLESLDPATGPRRIVLELGGTADPHHVENILHMHSLTKTGSSSLAVDALVTVVDIDAIGKLAPWSRDASMPGGKPPHLDLLIRQIEYADIVLLNKCDLATKRQRRRVASWIEHVNPAACRYETVHGIVEPSTVLGTGLFQRRDRDMNDLGNDLCHHHLEPAVPCPYVSWRYERRRPFHPTRLHELLRVWKRHDPGVLRGMGMIWLASRHARACDWSQVPGSVTIRPGSWWWAAAPAEFWPMDARILHALHHRFQAPWGDRVNDIQFVGHRLDISALERQLDSCLLDDPEMDVGPVEWSHLGDPFPHLDHRSVELTVIPEAQIDLASPD